MRDKSWKIGLALLTLVFSLPASADEYLDDRSTPQKLIESFYNAINQQQYPRAYGYYANNGSAPKNFQRWADGYASTKHVSMKFGPTEPDPGAGQIYWALPVALSVLGTDGKTTIYIGCYEIHMANPGVFTNPPHEPMGIEDGHFEATGKSFDTAASSLKLMETC